MRLALGLVLVLIGVVWVLQGLDVGFAPRSFMTGETRWIIWGVGTSLAGLSIMWWDRRSR